MKYLPNNIKFLREKFQLTQQELASKLGINRSSIADYERGNAEPNIRVLTTLATCFKTNIDALLCRAINVDDFEITRTQDLRVLAITIDSSERENIEFVEQKASAGYLNGYADPTYIRDLPKIYFPRLPVGTYRAFEIQGDSMLPVLSGSVIIARFSESFEMLKDNKTCIIVTQSEGILYKRYRKGNLIDKIILESDNDIYPPILIQKEDITEIWEFYSCLSFQDNKPSRVDILSQLNQLRNGVEEIKSDLRNQGIS